MKDVWNLMDVIHGKEYRSFLVLMLITTITLWIDYTINIMFFDYTLSNSHVVQLSGRFILIVWINIFIMLILHIKSQRRFIKTGGLQRIQLLPMKPYSYMLEETMFSIVTILLQLLGVYLALLCMYLVHGVLWGNIDSGFIYMILNHNSLGSILLPTQTANLCMLVTGITCLSLCFVTVKLSLQNASMMMGTMVLLLIIIIPGIMTFASFSWSTTNNSLGWIYTGTFIIMSIGMYYRLQKAFVNGKVGG